MGINFFISVTSVLLSSGIIVLLYIVYKKLSLAVNSTKRQHMQATNNSVAKVELAMNNTFSQIESLLSIYASIRPVHGLSPTRGWPASPDFLRYLIQFATGRNPKTIVECGSGVSTVILAYYLQGQGQGQGRLLSLESSPEFAEKTREMLEIHGLQDWAEVVVAPLIETELDDWKGRYYDLSLLPEDITIDMLVVDGPPGATSPLARFPAIPLLGKNLGENAIIIMDDAKRNDEKAIMSLWLEYDGRLSPIDYLNSEKGIAVFEITQKNATTRSLKL